MKKRIWNVTAIILTVLSVSCFVLTVLFWIRSVTIGDMLTWRRSPRQMDVCSLNGVLQIDWGEIVSRFPAAEGWTGTFWPFHRTVHQITADRSLWSGTWLGFRYEQIHRHAPPLSVDEEEVCFPYWFLALATGILPFWQALKFRRRRAMGPGICPACHYDLRAHRPGDKCPECGTPIGGDMVK